MSETETKDVGADGCKHCDTPEEEMLVVKDLNLDYPWKGGNMYARFCPNCSSRTFCAKSYWETQDVKYIIPQGEDKPRPQYHCPYSDEVVEQLEDDDGDPCGEPFLGPAFDSDEIPEQCPECDRELMWD